MFCGLFIAGLLGCCILGLVGLFLFSDAVERWEDEKLEHDRRL